jgi:hypothetical protein
LPSPTYQPNWKRPKLKEAEGRLPGPFETFRERGKVIYSSGHPGSRWRRKPLWVKEKKKT